MKDSLLLLLLLISFHCVVACGGDVATNTVGSVTTGTTGGNQAVGATSGANGGAQSVPANHRPTEITCPEQRGAGDASGHSQEIGDPCGQDSDCTAGMNGRCLWFHISYCSYDTCFSDSDCPNNLVCECRQSASSSVANVCMADGDCRVDSDCGPGGFCSPSLAGSDCVCLQCTSSACSDTTSCGHGYFCHTQQDTCVNDSDCNGATCVYDMSSKRWGCSSLSCAF
jgi:hypothetical protein